MLEQDIGKSLRQRRKVLKITQPHLAELAGVSTNMLYKIERGQVNPTVGIVQKIADVLGMEVIIRVKLQN
ncbi:MAG: XRE family transcriptional regulator [Clostridia bacterium]|nr:XRE family transcriptional regulator [Clostridia bacterium]